MFDGREGKYDLSKEISYSQQRQQSYIYDCQLETYKEKEDRKEV